MTYQWIAFAALLAFVIIILWTTWDD